MLALLLALPLAQDSVSESVVTAPRSRATLTTSEAVVTEVTAEELEQTGERSLPRALQKAAGGALWVQETNLGGGAPVLRGLLGNRILIVVDGVRVNDSTTRLGPNQSLNNFETNEVQRVEIVRGPSSVLWGSDAIGGVVLIWTKRAGVGADGFEASSGLRASYDSTVDGGRAGPDAVLRDEGWGLFATGSWSSADDLESGDGTVEHTGYRSRSYFASFERALGERRSLRVTASAHEDLDVPRTDKLIVGFGQTEPTHEEFEFHRQDRRRFVAALSDDNAWALADGTQVRLSFRTYTERRRKRETGSDVRALERDDVATVGLGVDLTKVLGTDHLLTYGFDVEHDDVDSTRTDVDLSSGTKTPADGAFAPNAEYRRAGVFVQDETRLGAFDATLGARYSFYDFGFDPFGGGPREEGDFDALTFAAQLARRVSEELRLTATASQGFRAPNLDDLANTGSFAGGTEIGNPDLEPEEALAFDLGAELDVGELEATGAVFYTHVDEVLGRVLLDEGDPGVSGDETYLRENVGELDLYGVEAAARHPLPLWRAGEEPQLFAAASATWTKGVQSDPLLDPDDGEVDARRIPPLFGRLALEARPREPLLGVGWLDVELRWADDQDDLHPQDVADPRIDPDGTPGWAVLNVDLGGRASGSLTWNAGVHNVFDERYRVHASGHDAPGLGVVFGAEWRP